MTRCSLMASSHRRHQQDKTVLSCLVGVRGVNWIGDKSRLSATENFQTVLSSLEMRCELSLVLSQPSFQFARKMVTYCDVIFGNSVKTSSQMRSHCGQDWTKLSCLRYIENSLRLLWTSHNSYDIFVMFDLGLWLWQLKLIAVHMFVLAYEVQFN